MKVIFIKRFLAVAALSASACGGDGSLMVFSYDQCENLGGYVSCASEGTVQCSYSGQTFYDIDFDACPLEASE